MKRIRLSGWALILSALIFLFGFAWDHVLNGPFTLFTVMIGLLGDLLFLIGLPGIQQSQPQTGRPGQIGLLLMGIGTVIAIIANLLIRLAGVGVPDWIPLTSAIAGSLGSLIVGWLTIRAHVFRPWIGWLMIAGAILNILAPVLPPGVIFISQLGLFAQAAALIGYGVTMLQRDVPDS
ncbi:MAG: hypothetical protein ACM3XO_03010 [Bacteroidota bacterium]